MLRDADKEMFSSKMGLLSEETLHKVQIVANLASEILQDDMNSAIVLSGCGTSGRLAFIITRSFNKRLMNEGLNPCFEYLIAGHDEALFLSRELAEDSPQCGVADLESVTRGKSRVLFVGITCGLSAAYVAGQLDYCMEHLDRFTPVLLGFNHVQSARNTVVEGWGKTFLQVVSRLQQIEAIDKGFILNPIVGPEPITGSTRMKSGSATKILLDTVFTVALHRRLGRLQMSVEKIIAAYQTVDEMVYGDVDTLSKVVDLAAQSLRNSGHIYYVSACDRLALCGLIDASECKPTYGADFQDVRGFLVGGFVTLGNRQGDLNHVIQISTDYFASEVVPKLTENDLVVLIGRDSRVWNCAALSDSKAVIVHGLYVSRDVDASEAELPLSTPAATVIIRIPDDLVTSFGGDVTIMTSLLELACKLTCNVLTTGAFVRKGKVFENYMIDLRVSNNKLFYRAISIVEKFGRCSTADATAALLKCIYDTDELTEKTQLKSTSIAEHIKQAAEQQQIVPLAILLARLRCEIQDGRRILSESPIVRLAIAQCADQPGDQQSQQRT